MASSFLIRDCLILQPQSVNVSNSGEILLISTASLLLDVKLQKASGAFKCSPDSARTENGP